MAAADSTAAEVATVAAADMAADMAIISLAG